MNTSPRLLALLACSALAIFLAEFQLGWNASVLYVLVVLLAGRFGSGRAVVVCVAMCSVLLGLAWYLSSSNIDAATFIFSRGFVIPAMIGAASARQPQAAAQLPVNVQAVKSSDFQDDRGIESDRLRIELRREQETTDAIEARNRLMIESALDAIIVITQDGLIEDWNPQAEITFGWTSDEVIGKSLAELIVPPQHRDAHRQGLQHYCTTEQGRTLNQRLELAAINRSGQEFPVELTIIPLNYSGRNHFCAFIRDIAELQQTHKELQERELRITAILNSTAEGIYGLDAEGKCTFANAACARLLGYESPHELIGLHMQETIHHSRADGSRYSGTQCPFATAYRDGKGTRVDDEVFWRKDGSSFAVEYWSYPKIDDGKVDEAVVSFVDITQRRELQLAQQQLHLELESIVSERNRELLELRERLELALTGGNIGLWDWDAKTNEVYYSPTYMAQLGYAEDVGWKHFSDWESHLHPDDNEIAHEFVYKYISHETPEYKSMFRMRCEDGTYRWILAQGTAVFNPKGKPTRMIGVHVDITESIENEQELKRLNSALEQVNEALQDSNVELQQFAYVASHDLQTPLRAISGFAQFLYTDCQGKLDEKSSNYLERIMNGVRRMQKMIDDLLDFSRVESRAAPFQPVCMEHVLTDTLGLLDASMKDTSANVSHDPLPTIVGDPSQLSQLLSNLIGNAIKYHRTVPVVHVSAIESDGGWTLLVRDNGIGIAEKDFDRIFELFRRLHNRDQYPGTGIGLAVCRRIVKRHQGKIWVTSEIGVGSTFHVWFPERITQELPQP